MPPEPAVVVATMPKEIDGRGWLMVMVAMLVIGLAGLRPSPTPVEPRRVACTASEGWMADALPGVGVKTRDLQWQKIRSGEIAALPERARTIARQVFIWPAAPYSPTHTATPTSDSGRRSHQ